MKKRDYYPELTGYEKQIEELVAKKKQQIKDLTKPGSELCEMKKKRDAFGEQIKGIVLEKEEVDLIHNINRSFLLGLKIEKLGKGQIKLSKEEGTNVISELTQIENSILALPPQKLEKIKLYLEVNDHIEGQNKKITNIESYVKMFKEIAVVYEDIKVLMKSINSLESAENLKEYYDQWALGAIKRYDFRLISDSNWSNKLDNDSVSYVLNELCMRWSLLEAQIRAAALRVVCIIFVLIAFLFFCFFLLKNKTKETGDKLKKQELVASDNSFYKNEKNRNKSILVEYKKQQDSTDELMCYNSQTKNTESS